MVVTSRGRPLQPAQHVPIRRDEHWQISGNRVGYSCSDGRIVLAAEQRASEFTMLLFPANRPFGSVFRKEARRIRAPSGELEVVA